MTSQDEPLFPILLENGQHIENFPRDIKTFNSLPGIESYLLAPNTRYTDAPHIDKDVRHLARQLGFQSHGDDGKLRVKILKYINVQTERCS